MVGPPQPFLRCVADPVAASEAALTAWPQLHSFAVGLPGAPDLLAARKAADYLGTTHHEFTFTLEEGEPPIRRKTPPVL